MDKEDLDMKENVWDKLHFFKPENTIDNWGEPERINPELLLKLDDFRSALGTFIIVTSGTGGEHSPNSQHYLGNAVDIVVPKFKGSLLDLYLIVERFNFNGIGLYDGWKYKNKVVGGLHLDMRPLKTDEDGTLFYRTNRWLGVSKKVKKRGKFVTTQKYHSFNEDNLKKYKFC